MKPGVPGDCWAECKQLRPCNAMYIVGPCIIVCCRLYEHRSILTARLPTAKPAHYSNRLCSQYAWTSRNFSYLLSMQLTHRVYMYTIYKSFFLEELLYCYGFLHEIVMVGRFRFIQSLLQGSTTTQRFQTRAYPGFFQLITYL